MGSGRLGQKVDDSGDVRLNYRGGVVGGAVGGLGYLRVLRCPIRFSARASIVRPRRLVVCGWWCEDETWDVRRSDA
ncbi:hypothetical protein [Nodularia spumigena]|uniref:hypothetical protein n=1 Tax=Nodularia spumigena TaxID=70799 RepID=UPI002B1EC936|nr:hypothetical protein [Nodularia spumigena]MEA5557704.1 hypothetical protein [Nodularia spumigena CH309]